MRTHVGISLLGLFLGGCSQPQVLFSESVQPGAVAEPFQPGGVALQALASSAAVVPQTPHPL